MRYLNEKAEKTTALLGKLSIKEVESLTGFKYQFCDYKKNNIIPQVDATWEEFPTFLPLTDKDIHMWVIGRVKTPPAQEGCYYALEFKQENPGSAIQVLLYVNGAMSQGLDRNHTRVFLEPDKEYDMAFYCYFDNVKPYVAITPKLITVCEKTEALYFDYATPYDALTALEPGSEDYETILHHLELAANRIDFRAPYTQAYYDSIASATEYLKTEFYEKECGKWDQTVDCLGHTHIDVAWLWPVCQTVEKTQRSFSTVLELMKRYPEYVFMSSSPQLYLFMKEQAPELYEEIKERVKEGRWEVDGAMWLEPDGNLLSGESFIRQLIYGKRFFKEEFGVDSRTLWLPDVFGYSAALPQILKKAGVDCFVTGKISWNDVNRMPNDTFLWKGIDGTEIFTQFLTNKDFVNPDTSHDFVMFNGALDAREIKSAWDMYKNKEYNNTALHTFGFGDGGGGPTYQMLERQRRFSHGIPGIPKTRMNTLDRFLTKTEENFRASCETFGRMPKWTGELYLEYHRGTYTSMAKTKRANRKCEFALAEAETLCVWDYLLHGTAYPDFSESWKLMLLNQFHDIIPGSSMKQVYDLSDQQYAQVAAFCQDTSKKARESIVAGMEGEGYVVFNPHSYTCSDVVETEGTYAYAENVPAMGWASFEKLSFENEAVIGKRSISNRYFDIRFDEAGNMVSLYDKANGRETLAGPANELRAYEDRPRMYEAWEVTHYYGQKCYKLDAPAEISEYRCGAKAGLTIKKKFMDSTIEQNIVVYDNIPRIDVETVIDWKEKNILVKALFPINVSANKVTADIQFGNVERATHTNTSWDEAKFEMCMHKWVDISDNSYGVSLLNDCKYGFSADENVLGLTILKSAEDPNPEADKCMHYLTYSIYPHAMSPVFGGTIQQAYNLNQSMTAVKKTGSGTCSESFSFVSCDRENIMIETVKKAEDSKDIIVRLFDAYNMTTDARIVFGFEIKKAYLCDLLENELEEISVNDGGVNLRVKNFEIVTLKLIR